MGCASDDWTDVKERAELKTPLDCAVDRATGHKVVRLSNLAEHCHHPYFYSRCFTPDSRRALVIARLEGAAHIRLVDVESGETEPLVAGVGIEEFLVTLDRNGRHLYYSQGQSLHRRTLATGEDEIVWTQRAPWDGDVVYPGFSDDYRYAVFAQMHRDDVVPRTTGWSHWEPQLRAKPRCRLVRVHLETGQEQVCHEEACWLGHPQLCPGDPDTLMYCHEGPGNLIDARVWLVQADGSRVRCVGYREETPGAGAPEYITHECFMPDGRHIAYLRLPKAAGEKVSVRLRQVSDFAPVREFAVEGYLHVGPSPDSRSMAADQRGRSPGDSFLWLLNLETGEQSKLCLHGSSYAIRGKHTQDAHPHPAFSPDGRKVLFTSDRETGPEGNCAVYLVEATAQ